MVALYHQLVVMLYRLFVLLVVLSSLGCDAVESPATEIRLGVVGSGEPLRVDPCSVVAPDPGFMLGADRVLYPDLCTGAIENVASCWISDYDDPDGLEPPEVPELDIWCEFVCPDGIEVDRVLADYPAGGDPVRYVIENPCAEVEG